MENSERELEEFIRESLAQIDAGLGNQYKPKETIEFEVAVTKTTTKGGKLGIKVAEAGISSSDQVTSRIKFEVGRDFKNHPAFESSRKTIEAAKHRRLNFTTELLDNSRFGSRIWI